MKLSMKTLSGGRRSAWGGLTAPIGASRLKTACIHHTAGRGTHDEGAVVVKDTRIFSHGEYLREGHVLDRVPLNDAETLQSLR